MIPILFYSSGYTINFKCIVCIVFTIYETAHFRCYANLIEIRRAFLVLKETSSNIP